MSTAESSSENGNNSLNEISSEENENEIISEENGNEDNENNDNENEISSEDNDDDNEVEIDDDDDDDDDADDDYENEVAINNDDDDHGTTKLFADPHDKNEKVIKADKSKWDHNWDQINAKRDEIRTIKAKHDDDDHKKEQIDKSNKIFFDP
eukprot:13778_1